MFLHPLTVPGRALFLSISLREATVAAQVVQLQVLLVQQIFRLQERLV